MAASRRVDPARRLALRVLRAVREQDAYANLDLGRRLREERLTGRDAGFATELASGTLRLQGSYDAIIDELVTRPLEPAVRDALRLGVHQLLSMRVSPHAAVTTTVDLVRQEVGHGPTGLVNAVLRKVGRRDLQSWLSGRSLAVRTSHPEWVVEELGEALGRPDELEALLAADNERPGVTLVARPGLADREELGGRPLDIAPYAVALDGGDPGALAAVRAGRAGVQDAGSQLVAVALARATVAGSASEPTPGSTRGRADGRAHERWLDLCAGPGGKAALLAALAAGQGARLLANERAPHRARLVAQSVRAAGAGMVGVIAGDGARPAWRPESFDRVLVDAPCTGLGALRRRPEARWRRRPEDIDLLVPLQVALLEAALDSCRPGGVVLYATCSPVVRETAGVVTTVLGRRDDAAMEDATALVAEAHDAGSVHLPGAVQLWPHRHGTDAMFMALLRRR